MTPEKSSESVYGPAPQSLPTRHGTMWLTAVVALAVAAIVAPAAAHAQAFDTTVVDARDALRKRDRNRLAALRAQAAAEKNPFAMWVDYWELLNRIGEVQQPEFTAFAQRWHGTYVEDRGRNDWLLELGRRRDWANVAAEFPRFRMNDDLQVTCYALVADHLAGQDVKESGLAAWMAQKDADDGCAVLATTLRDAKKLGTAEIWNKVRLSLEANKPRGAKQAAALISEAAAASVAQIVDSPSRYLAKKAAATPRSEAELTTMALARLASSDSESAAALLVQRWEKLLPGELASWAWASVARQTATKLQPEAADQFLRAGRMLAKTSREIDLPDETLAWKVRSALRADAGRPRWQAVVQAINAMSPAEQKDAAWVYWKARGLRALAPDSQDGASLLATSRELFSSIAGQLGFYGGLAAEELGQPQALPPRPQPLTAAEHDAPASQPGLVRGLTLIAIGLRNEGVREWNYSVRGLADRELLAAAQYACEREIWDRCINTSEKTKNEIDLEQRYPTPLKKDVTLRAREIGLDPAFVYGLIRQ
ncbi:MAG: lytic transglycosylase domain-containing protein, partial [Caldimonas sp.]